MRFSYQTLYSFILNDQIPCFHRKKKLEQKQIQTAILKVNTSEHIQKESLYIFFFPSVWILQSSLVSEKNKNGLCGGFDFKTTTFLRGTSKPLLLG